MLPPDTALNDRYRLMDPIGEGGMATVYRALDMRLGRPVAIKLLHPEYVRDRPFLQRFQQEAEFAASLGAHPNVVAIYDIGEDGNLRFIVMELVDGRNLKDLIRERAPFPVAEAFAIGAQVASALDFAHKRGLVHRDVKPQNILMTADGSAKVTDFGIARSVAASQLTRTGTVIGTAHYFSPEQAQGQPAAPASDIYSLGIIVYEMLTGHLPFDADTPIGVAMQHVHSEPPSPWTYNPGLPARAVATVMRALEKDPARRYRDAGEFGAAMAAQGGEFAGGTTAISPIVEAARQPTSVLPVPEPEPRRIVATETRLAPPATSATVPVARPTNQLRLLALVLGGLLLIGAIAALSFFLASGSFSGGAAATATATGTPTATATATPRPHKTPAPTSTPVPVVVATTAAPLPTFTPTPPPPTKTPVPPTRTPVPPTSTPVPTQVPTVVLLGPTSTSTATG